jgi:hypothetical protein
MKVTLRKLLMMAPGFRELGALVPRAVIGSKIGKVLTQVDDELKSFETVRDAAIKKYSSDEKAVDEDKIPLLEAELNELLDSTEIELFDANIKESDLFECKASGSMFSLLRGWFAQETSE